MPTRPSLERDRGSSSRRSCTPAGVGSNFCATARGATAATVAARWSMCWAPRRPPSCAGTGAMPTSTRCAATPSTRAAPGQHARSERRRGAPGDAAHRRTHRPRVAGGGGARVRRAGAQPAVDCRSGGHAVCAPRHSRKALARHAFWTSTAPSNRSTATSKARKSAATRTSPGVRATAPTAPSWHRSHPAPERLEPCAPRGARARSPGAGPPWGPTPGGGATGGHPPCPAAPTGRRVPRRGRAKSPCWSPRWIHTPTPPSRSPGSTASGPTRRTWMTNSKTNLGIHLTPPAPTDCGCRGLPPAIIL